MTKRSVRWAGWVLVGWLGLVLSACSAPAADFLRPLLAGPAAAFVAEGDRQAAAGRVAEAILAYRQAIERDARYIPALRKLGHAYAAQGRRRLAQRYLQRAATLRPEDQEIAAELAALQAAEPPGGPLSRAWIALADAGRPAGMALGEGMLIVAWEDGRLIAMDAAGAAPRWESRLPSRATSAPTVAAGKVFIGAADGALHALSAADGQPLWRYQTAAPIYAAALATPDAVYVASGDGTFSALAPADGAVRWQIAAVAPLTGAPAAA
ncbi:MAG: PQQ-binding-like beta-propeller repeat protein, partial [Anaerolineae bacterium]